MTRKPTLHFIDRSSRVRAELARIAFDLGHHAEVYGDLEELSLLPPREGIIVARDDPAESGVAAMIDRLGRMGIWLPLVVFDHQPGAGRIVDAIKAGALDYLSLPIDTEKFVRCIQRVEEEAEAYCERRKREIEAHSLLANLSRREGEVLDLLAQGSSNKTIARELAISPRTVEIHRSNMMSKLGARHPADAVRLRIDAQAGTKKS